VSSSASFVDCPPAFAPPTTVVTVVGVSVAVWCAGFAAISIWFEVTDYFGAGAHAAYASGISVVNWFVTVIKVMGVVVALPAVARRRPRLLAPRALGTLLWAAFATIGIYVLGSVTQAVLMLTGLAGDADQIDVASVAYLLLFICAAAGFGILAFSYARRAGLGRHGIVLGVAGAPIVLGGVLVVLPAVLTAMGLLPSS
jgi:hypothetical protein